MTVTSLQVPNQDAGTDSLQNIHYPRALPSFKISVTGNRAFTHMRMAAFRNYLRIQMLALY